MGIFNFPKKFNIKSEIGLPDQDSTGRATIEFKNNEVIFTYFKSGFSFKRPILVLKPDDIISVDYSQENYRSAGKAAAGAVAGALLTGGVGLLAGAALGGRRKKEDRLSVIAMINGVNTQVILLTKQNTQNIYNEFHKILALRKPKPEQSGNNNNDVIQQLKDLQKLKEEGIITEEELQIQKNKILNK